MTHHELDRWALEIEEQIKLRDSDRIKLSGKHRALCKARDRLYDLRVKKFENEGPRFCKERFPLILGRSC